MPYWCYRQLYYNFFYCSKCKEKEDCFKLANKEYEEEINTKEFKEFLKDIKMCPDFFL